MQIASALPHPYILDRAGAVCLVNEFSLIGDQLKVVPANERILPGTCYLIYRCSNHQSYDIRWAVGYDGTTWSLVERLSQESDPGGDNDICYPGPRSA